MKNTKAQTKNPTANNESELYPIHIPESQGDLADRAEIEIEQEIQQQIYEAQKAVHLKPKAKADISKVLFAQFKWVLPENPSVTKNSAP